IRERLDVGRGEQAEVFYGFQDFEIAGSQQKRHFRWGALVAREAFWRWLRRRRGGRRHHSHLGRRAGGRGGLRPVLGIYGPVLMIAITVAVVVGMKAAVSSVLQIMSRVRVITLVLGLAVLVVAVFAILAEIGRAHV